MTTLSDIILPSALLTVDNTKTVTNKTISGASNTIENLNASNLSSGTVATARLASGTASSSTYLRGDQTWAAAGLNYFSDAESTASPNNTVYVDSLSATGASTNVDVAIVPKGTGAFLLAVPDGTVTGGNKRGTYAVDLQLKRLSTLNVASGNYSFAAGADSTCSGDYSVSIGRSNSPDGAYNACIGYANSTNNGYAVAMGYSNSSGGTAAVTLGYDNTAATVGAAYATAIGYQNQVSVYAGVGLGYQNTVSGSYGTAIGANNVAASAYSAAMGYSSVSDGVAAIAVGYNGDARGRYSVFNIGADTGSGDAKTHTSLFTVGNTTTDATPTALTANTAAGEAYWNRMDTYCAYAVKILVVGMDTGGSYDAKSWEISALVKTTTGQPSIVGAITKNVVAADSGASSWDVDLVMSTTTRGFTIQVTGAAATTIRWTGSMYSAEALAA